MKKIYEDKSGNGNKFGNITELKYSTEKRFEKVLKHGFFNCKTNKTEFINMQKHTITNGFEYLDNDEIIYFIRVYEGVIN